MSIARLQILTLASNNQFNPAEDEGSASCFLSDKRDGAVPGVPRKVLRLIIKQKHFVRFLKFLLFQIGVT